jgi:hypothetical protein
MTKKYKSASYGYKLPHIHGYPFDGAYYALCDICGRKERVKNLKMTYGTRGTLLVCQSDYEDPHPQDYIKSFKERMQPALTRPERADVYEFIDTPEEIETGETTSPSGRSPGAPTSLVAAANSSTTIELTWKTDTTEPGSGPICGFKIERESPEGNGFATIVDNTGFPSLYYKDTGLTTATEYNYRVSAINSNGTGSASGEAKDTTD